MLIKGFWKVGSDHELRPIIEASVSQADGSWCVAAFLVDSGADRTVLSADVLNRLGVPPVASAEHIVGIGGQTESVVVETSIRMTREDGSFVRFNGRFMAFTRTETLDTCVLGRDLMNYFALIIDRPQEIVCLLGQNHRYAILSA